MKIDYLGLDSEADGTNGVFLQTSCLYCNWLFVTVHKRYHKTCTNKCLDCIYSRPSMFCILKYFQPCALCTTFFLFSVMVCVQYFQFISQSLFLSNLVILFEIKYSQLVLDPKSLHIQHAHPCIDFVVILVRLIFLLGTYQIVFYCAMYDSISDFNVDDNVQFLCHLISKL